MRKSILVLALLAPTIGGTQDFSSGMKTFPLPMNANFFPLPKTEPGPQAGPVSFVAWDKPTVSYPTKFTVRRSKTATGCADPLASSCTLLTTSPVDGTELPKPPTLSASVTCCWYADTLGVPGGWFYTVQTAFVDTDGSVLLSANAKLQTPPPTGPDYALRVLLPPAAGFNFRIP